MAKVRKNIVTHGLAGKPGGAIVFRQRGGSTNGRDFFCLQHLPYDAGV